MTIDRRAIFALAWENAKAAADLFGKASARELFASCLKSAWANAKRKAALAAALTDKAITAALDALRFSPMRPLLPLPLTDKGIFHANRF